MNYELNYTVVFLSLTFWPEFITLYDDQPGELLQKTSHVPLSADVQAWFLHNALPGSILKLCF